MQSVLHNKLLLATYVMTVLLALHIGIPLYATSTYLSKYIAFTYIAPLFALASIVTLLASLHFTKYLRKYHTYPFIFSIVVLEMIVTTLFGFADNVYLISVLFIFHFCIQAIILTTLNLFVEMFTKHAETGMVRGIFLTLYNLGILVSPFIAGSLLTFSSFGTLYAVASLTLIPFLYYLKKYMSHVPDPTYHSIDLIQAFKKAMVNTNLRGAIIANFLLECFYAIMVISFPIYIVSLGVPLIVYLTVIVPICLIPLVILPYELGFIADKKLGEKEILIFGLILLALGLLAMTVTTTSIVLVWIIILFVTRIGASCVETMAFTYFYKKIAVEDASLTALFTNMKTLAVAVVGGISLILSPILMAHPSFIFIAMALGLLYGVTQIIPIRDTR